MAILLNLECYIIGKDDEFRQVEIQPGAKTMTRTYYVGYKLQCRVRIAQVLRFVD